MCKAALWLIGWECDEEEDEWNIEDEEEEYYSELSRQISEEEMNMDYEEPITVTIHPPLVRDNVGFIENLFPEYAPPSLEQEQLLYIKCFNLVSDELYHSLYLAMLADDPFFCDFIANLSTRQDLPIPFPSSEFVDLGKGSDLGFEDAELKLEDFDSKLVLEKNTKDSEGDELDKIGGVEMEIDDDLGESLQVLNI